MTQAYHDTTTCDFRPEWVITDPVAVGMLDVCWDADPDDLTPQLILADRLADLDHPSEAWIRLGCALWQTAAELKPGTKDEKDDWAYNNALAVLKEVTETEAGRWVVGLWGCLLAWHAPTGYGVGTMGRTWVHPRVFVAQKWCWWAAMRLAVGGQANVVRTQTAIAQNQINATRSLVDATQRLVDAMWHKANATRNLVDATQSSVYAAHHLADAVSSLVEVARQQACAVGDQVLALQRQRHVWAYAKMLWEETKRAAEAAKLI